MFGDDYAGAKRLQARVAEFKGEVTNETWEGGSFKVEVLVDPGVFRGVDEAVSAIGKGEHKTEEGWRGGRTSLTSER